MATEDHDLDEVNQALLLTHDFQLAPFTAKTTGIDGRSGCAHSLRRGNQRDRSREAAKLLGESLAADYLRESYAEGETFSNAFAKLYTRIFSRARAHLPRPG